MAVTPSFFGMQTVPTAFVRFYEGTPQDTPKGRYLGCWDKISGDVYAVTGEFLGKTNSDDQCGRLISTYRKRTLH